MQWMTTVGNMLKDSLLARRLYAHVGGQLVAEMTECTGGIRQKQWCQSKRSTRDTDSRGLAGLLSSYVHMLRAHVNFCNQHLFPVVSVIAGWMS